MSNAAVNPEVGGVLDVSKTHNNQKIVITSHILVF